MIKYIFFDLGSTLIHSKDPWEPFFQAGNLILAEALHRAGVSIPGRTIQEEFENFLENFYAGYSPTDTNERTMYSVLRNMLDEEGYSNIPNSAIRVALEKLYGILNRNWYPEDDSLSTLVQLRNAGYRMGIISNTADDAHVQRLVDGFGFRSHMDFVITSAALGFRKPDRRIFQVALDHFRAKAEQAAMVGDLLEADILGANEVGLLSIWITRRSGCLNSNINPHVTVKALAEIPAILESLK